MLRQSSFARLHRSTRHEDNRDIEAHRGIEHTGRNLVAVRDTDHGVGAVRIHHVLNRVSNDVAGRQTVEHAVVSHSNPVINGDGVKFFSDTARIFDFSRYQLTEVF